MGGREVVLLSSFVGDLELIVFTSLRDLFPFAFCFTEGGGINATWYGVLVLGLKIGMFLGSM